MFKTYNSKFGVTGDLAKKLISEGKIDDKTPILFEGVDLDLHNKRVILNFEHEDRVNTSLVSNPKYYKVEGVDVTVQAIFERKSTPGLDKSDGNPLLYALKGLKGWSISTADVKKLHSRFVRIAHKLEKGADVAIATPSSNALNDYFIEQMGKILNTPFLPSPDIKMTNEDVKHAIAWNKIPDGDKKALRRAFDRISQEEGEVEGDQYSAEFQMKKIPPALRKYISEMYTLNKANAPEVSIADKLLDKKVLIIDDTVTTGRSLSLYVSRIIEHYRPKEVSVLTLFSPIVK